MNVDYKTFLDSHSFLTDAAAKRIYDTTVVPLLAQFNAELDLKVREIDRLNALLKQQEVAKALVVEAPVTAPPTQQPVDVPRPSGRIEKETLWPFPEKEKKAKKPKAPKATPQKPRQVIFEAPGP
jgi:hypothetical protein